MVDLNLNCKRKLKLELEPEPDIKRLSSPSNKDFQNFIQLKRVRLRSLLEELIVQGYIHKERKGRETYYSLSAQYLPYFREQ